MTSLINCPCCRRSILQFPSCISVAGSGRGDGDDIAVASADAAGGAGPAPPEGQLEHDDDRGEGQQQEDDAHGQCYIFRIVLDIIFVQSIPDPSTVILSDGHCEYQISTVQGNLV